MIYLACLMCLFLVCPMCLFFVCFMCLFLVCAMCLFLACPTCLFLVCAMCVFQRVLCEVCSLCHVRFLVLDLARLRLASWLASLATCVPGWACTKEKLLKLSCQQYQQNCITQSGQAHTNTQMCIYKRSSKTDKNIKSGGLIKNSLKIRPLMSCIRCRKV